MGGKQKNNILSLKFVGNVIDMDRKEDLAEEFKSLFFKNIGTEVGENKPRMAGDYSANIRPSINSLRLFPTNTEEIMEMMSDVQ